MGRWLFPAALCVAHLFIYPATAEQFSIHDAINMAVQTNPGVGEAAANRRATEAEMRQSQGALLPQVRLQYDPTFPKWPAA